MKIRTHSFITSYYLLHLLEVFKHYKIKKEDHSNSLIFFFFSFAYTTLHLRYEEGT